MNIDQLKERFDTGQLVVAGMVRSAARKLAEHQADALLAATQVELPVVVQQLTEEAHAAENPKE